ncbi:MAG: hypothetical protein J6K17_03140 [Oscillospiraceae bacterium]|nr:hypothetical protein [Oscillospiraceae bacterium]
MKLDYIKVIDENGGVMHGGNQSHFTKNINRSGCGMIAACDMLLYLQNSKNLPLSEYNRFVAEKSKSYFYKMHFNLVGISASRIIKFLSKQGHRFCFIPWYKLKGDLLEKKIKKSIENNIPVIVRIGLNRNRLPYKLSNTASGRITQGKMSWHYITVIGIENSTLHFSSWGRAGEMELSDLQQHIGFMGGIICTE